MTTEQQISAIQDERDDAREDLREALTLVNAKVGRAEDDLRPERMIENHSMGAALIAARSRVGLQALRNASRASFKRPAIRNLFATCPNSTARSPSTVDAG